jgi:signal transduction histidine kinase
MRFRARTTLLIVLVAAVASVFSATIAYQTVRNDGRVPDTLALAVLNTAFWFGWAALSLPLAMLSSRWRIDRTPRVAIPLHIAAALTAGAVHICLQTTAQAALYVRSAFAKGVDVDALATFAERWAVLAPMQLLQLIDWELLAGMGVVALAHAVFYYRETQDRALREANLETRLMEAQLTALQQQLQPHFLFNTLHAISTLMHRDVDLADKVLVRLSDLLRITLESGHRKEIPLSEELDFIRKYLDIEKMRIGDRLTMTLEIDPESLDCQVPTLILQPLVENAVKYGVAPHTGPGHIEIRTSRRNGQMTLSVSDNGPGPVTDERVRPGGIGLANTRARLLHHFGDDGDLQLDRRPDGFIATLTFPCRN